MIALNQLKPEREVEAIPISMTTIEQPKKEEKPEPPKPEPVAAAQPVPKAAPSKVAPPPEAPTTPAPDFGFVMSGNGGPGGIAVPTAAPVTPPRQTVKKLVAAAAPVAEAGCDEPEVKPKATAMPHPSYTEAAKAAAIEGKVRVELNLTAEGNVADAKVIEGLGFGLDEAALTALRAASFSPATKCGKAISSKFTVSVRFAL